MIKKLSIFLIYDGQKLPLTILNWELVSRGRGTRKANSHHSHRSCSMENLVTKFVLIIPGPEIDAQVCAQGYGRSLH